MEKFLDKYLFTRAGRRTVVRILEKFVTGMLTVAIMVLLTAYFLR